MTALADRLVASTVAPTGTHNDPGLAALGVVRIGDYEIVDEPYDHPGLADISRYVIYFAPRLVANLDRDDYADSRSYVLARRAAAKRGERIRSKAGSIELRTDRIAWTAFRPDKRTAPLSREVGEYPFANDAVREVLRRDRSYRRKSR